MTEERGKNSAAPPGFRPFIGQRKNRRPLVITGAGTFVLLVSMLELVHILPIWLYYPLLALLALLALMHALVFSAGVQVISQHGEAQQHAWSRAHHQAHRVTFWLLSGLLAYWLVASSLLLWLPRGTSEILLVFVGFWGLVLVLPAMLLFWNEPDLELG